MSRDVYTRAEVVKILAAALFESCGGASRSLMANGERKAADVMQRMAMRFRRDEVLVNALLDDAEDKGCIGPLIVDTAS